MAVSAFTYAQANFNAFLGLINDLSDNTNTTVKCALMADTYTPAQNTDDAWADISADETSGTGYTSGGQEITNKAMTQSGGDAVFDGDNVAWTSSTIDARYAVIYESGSGKLLAYVDFGENKSSSNGTFEIQWSTDGIFKITATQAA